MIILLSDTGTVKDNFLHDTEHVNSCKLKLLPLGTIMSSGRAPGFTIKHDDELTDYK